MVGAFVGFWMVLPLLASGPLLSVAAPAAFVVVLALALAGLLPAARPFALGVAAGVVTGALLAALVGQGLLAVSTGG